MRPEDFEFLAKLLKEGSGLVLGSDKIYLVENRLLPVAQRWGKSTLADLVRLLRAGNDRALLSAVNEAMAIHESFFFRDVRPFDQFRTIVLPALLRERAAARSIRIWSAACSSGQEPYSLAMILAEEAARLAGWHVEILATDFSRDILERAKAGVYSHFEAQRGLPIRFLTKYFTRQGEEWRIADQIRQMVRFECQNLLETSWSPGRFDVIFCRNVLIYFDQPTKARILAMLARALPADGYLFLGGAETVIGLTDALQTSPDQRGIYTPTPAPLRAAV